MTYPQPVDPTNVVGPRIGAWFIDLVIYFVFMAVAGGVGLATTAETAEFNSQFAAERACDVARQAGDDVRCVAYGTGEDWAILSVEDLWLTPIAWGLHLAAYVVIQGLLGGSIGKLAVGLRVVDDQGAQAGLGRSLVRTLLWVVDAITFGLPIIGGIMIATTRGHRRVGDQAAGTYVVRKEHVGAPVVVPFRGAPMGYSPQGYDQPGYGPGYAPAPAPPPSTGSDPDLGSGPTWGAPPPMAAAPGADAPTWDAARGTYIQYDRTLEAWMEWDARTSSWVPIST